ncbi:unnamed protein product [Nesidiocoris tenuis]|uniref:Uncharacterized protein n=1 Tax=Nesidiocoris tenuis TaxID=355587 RepID=A0A6H5G7R3_9HEMI|nr:unnamed protein product [Nesidiocoris tenuis]
MPSRGLPEKRNASRFAEHVFAKGRKFEEVVCKRTSVIREEIAGDGGENGFHSAESKRAWKRWYLRVEHRAKGGNRIKLEPFLYERPVDPILRVPGSPYARGIA